MLSFVSQPETNSIFDEKLLMLTLTSYHFVQTQYFEQLHQGLRFMFQLYESRAILFAHKFCESNVSHRKQCFQK